MIRKLHGLSPNEKVPPLASCSCDKRQNCRWVDHLRQQQSQPKQSTPKKPSTEDQTPQGHECIRAELLSLLFTGKSHSDTVSWNADNLGIGLLSVDETDDALGKTGGMNTGSSLKFPPKPVWLVRGDVYFSTLWNNNMMPPGSRSYSFDNEESDSLVLTHWTCWYGVQNKTEMRVIPRTPKQHGVRLLSAMSGLECNAITKRKESEKANPISAKEILSTEVHLEDERYYPNNFRHWRFRFNYYKEKSSSKGGHTNDDEDGAAQSQKLPAWITFFRLNRRQKEIVERKMSPRINLAIWSKWPDATVDKIKNPIAAVPIS